MGDPSVEVTEEDRDASQEAKAKGMEALSEGISFLFIICVCMLVTCIQLFVWIYYNYVHFF